MDAFGTELGSLSIRLRKTQGAAMMAACEAASALAAGRTSQVMVETWRAAAVALNLSHNDLGQLAQKAYNIEQAVPDADSRPNVA